MSVYDPGENVEVFADIFPAQISPLPPGVPSGTKLRVIIAVESLTVAWSGGRGAAGPIVHRWDERLTPEETAAANFKGGQVGNYTVSRGAGCACGAAGLKNWNPFEGNTIVALSRIAKTLDPNAPPGPTRYSRS